MLYGLENQQRHKHVLNGDSVLFCVRIYIVCRVPREYLGEFKDVAMFWDG